MEEYLITGILEFLELPQYSFSLILMHVSFLDQEQIIDIRIVSELIRYQFETYCEALIGRPQVAHLSIQAELLVLVRNRFLEVFNLKEL